MIIYFLGKCIFRYALECVHHFSVLWYSGIHIIPQIPMLAKPMYIISKNLVGKVD